MITILSLICPIAGKNSSLRNMFLFLPRGVVDRLIDSFPRFTNSLCHSIIFILREMMQKFLLLALALCMLILPIFGAKKTENVPVSQTIEEQQSHVEQPSKSQEASRLKLHKPKSLKSITEYELCKQECKRKRDQESMSEYVQWLNEELKFAEEQLRIQNENTQSAGDQKQN